MKILKPLRQSVRFRPTSSVVEFRVPSWSQRGLNLHFGPKCLKKRSFWPAAAAGCFQKGCFWGFGVLPGRSLVVFCCVLVGILMFLPHVSAQIPPPMLQQLHPHGRFVCFSWPPSVPVEPPAAQAFEPKAPNWPATAVPGSGSIEKLSLVLV